MKTRFLFLALLGVFVLVTQSCAKDSTDPPSKGGGAGGMEITFDTTPWAEETLFF